MKVAGRVKRVALAGVTWQLIADDGKKYQLDGGDDGLRVDGQAVVVEGELGRGRVSIGMSAPILVVSSYVVVTARNDGV